MKKNLSVTLGIILGIIFGLGFWLVATLVNASELSEEQKCYERAAQGEKLISVTLEDEYEIRRCYLTMVSKGYVPVHMYGHLMNIGRATKTDFVLITFEKKYPARWEK